MNQTQRLTIIVGTSGIIFHLAGMATEIECLNLLAAFLGRISAILYLTAIDRFRYYSLIPTVFSLFSIIYGSTVFLYMSLCSQGLIYQYIAYQTFKKLSK